MMPHISLQQTKYERLGASLYFYTWVETKKDCWKKKKVQELKEQT